MKLDERKFVLALKAGDITAFDTLYTMYKERMTFFAIKFIRSREIVEDIYHDVFAQIWINRANLDETKSFSSFLYTIVKNRLLDEIRKQLRDEQFREALTTDISHDETLNGILKDDFDKLYNESLNNLTPQQRTVFSMSRNDYKTYKEISEHLGISINTVKSHLTQASAVIRTYLSKYIDE